MPFEIEKITKTVKKNPVPWAIGAGIAVVGGYIVFNQRTDTGYLTEAKFEEPVAPTEEIASGPEKPGDYTDAQLAELLAELERGKHEDIQQIREMNTAFLESFAKSLENYINQDYSMQVQEPITEMVFEPEIIKKAEYVYQTPSIFFQPKGASYTPKQVEVMYNWAVEENVAITRGTSTSINPRGLKENDMTVTYYKTGHVEFTPKTSKGKMDKKRPVTYPDTPVGRALKEAERREKSGEVRQAVSKVTGKTGSIEKQLSGMSTEEKIGTLKKAGLY